eukprot:CAMPEP_0206502324 /NCGR_PEP_ID=MMETSP0324_2-20121206/53927_1 /ASSEMBLY_ACC=CAM_ASM_000836 /TAXON_ID=2866 /ORGANISM="Crypthecodinium cohnii, Strain Seligo" /LENGTH=205 /DNA_ID=CAMNT_0053990491 /DNA_START=325 /DNA_END=938 /DNA_ORIENTATION=-
MRHCVRSTKQAGIKAVPGMQHFNNYSKSPWPDFGVPPYGCTPQGLESLKSLGDWWKRRTGRFSPEGPLGSSSLPMPLRIVADDCDRDVASARAFLDGLYGTEVPVGALDVDAKPYLPTAQVALKFEGQEVAVEIASRLESMPEEANFAELHDKFWELLGPGEAGDWRDAPCEVEPATGQLIGRCIATSAFAERFLMEWGSGKEFA